MKNYISNQIDLINKALTDYLPDNFPNEIWNSMRYSVDAGGKRLRPLLVLESAKICGGSIELALPAACALEMVHTYSLIHDDLPCMDNDDYRRGKLTNHKVFGEAIAVLAGDGLLSLAPQIIIQHTPATVKSSLVLKLLDEFFSAIGPSGMIGGQVVDIISENKTIDVETFEYIHTHKTGKLFEFALRSGAILAESDNDTLNVLTEYAKILGFAFQIADDILDEISTFEKLGKTPHKDVNSHKNTHTSIYGLENSKKELHLLCNRANELLKYNNINSDLLYWIIQNLEDKIKGA